MINDKICCFYDVADIMSIENRQSFLANLMNYLYDALDKANMMDCAVRTENQRDFEFKLFLQMVPLEYNVPFLRKLQDDVEMDKIYKRHLSFYKANIFNRFKYREIIRRIEYRQLRMDRILSVSEVFELAASHYYQQGWGDGSTLKRDLEILTIK
ncbi:MAG: hypothetical protein J6K16_05110 [Alphaproteobacteria bacterium]|nr:hypothetical protein [Alphaproteobacteria bacterium]